MHKHARWTAAIALLLLVSLMAVPGLAQDRQPETTQGTSVPTTPGPLAPLRPLVNGGQLLYKTSLDLGDAGFSVYDPTTNAWTPLAPFETGCQMAAGPGGTLFAYDYANGDIRAYDPATDTWSHVIPVPPGSSGYQCNLELTVAGEFLYTEWTSNTLWYTVGGVWNTMVLPFVGNAVGDYEPATDQYVIGQQWTTNAHLIDVHTWGITDYTSPVGNGENARFGVVMSNRFYFEAGGSNIHYFELGNPAAPPIDTGVNLAFYSSAAADRRNHIVYGASLDGTQLWAYDEATNTAAPLAGGSFGWHSSLALVDTAGGGPTMHIAAIQGAFRVDPYGRAVLRADVQVHKQDHTALGTCEVLATITYPGPSGSQSAQRMRYTRWNGWARFYWGSAFSGDWSLCVDNLTKSGYAYAPGDDEVPNCLSW